MFLFFDTESNKMLDFKLAADHPDQARIVSIAAVLTDDALTPVGGFHCLIQPDGWAIDEEAGKVHGLTLERCARDGIQIAHAMTMFDALADRAQTLVAFNIRWDNKFIRGERRRLGREDRFGVLREFDPCRAATGPCNLPPTPAMMRAGRNYNKTPNLSEACQILLGRPHDEAHNAMADCLATIDVTRCLRDQFGVDIRGEFPQSRAACA